MVGLKGNWRFIPSKTKEQSYQNIRYTFYSFIFVSNQSRSLGLFKWKLIKLENEFESLSGVYVVCAVSRTFVFLIIC